METRKLARHRRGNSTGILVQRRRPGRAARRRRRRSPARAAPCHPGCGPALETVPRPAERNSTTSRGRTADAEGCWNVIESLLPRTGAFCPGTCSLGAGFDASNADLDLSVRLGLPVCVDVSLRSSHVGIGPVRIGGPIGYIVDGGPDGCRGHGHCRKQPHRSLAGLRTSHAALEVVALDSGPSRSVDHKRLLRHAAF